MNYYGLDCHSDNIKMVIFDADGRFFRRMAVKLHTDSFQTWLASLTQDDYCALEISTNSFMLYDRIRPLVKDCFILNAKKMPEIFSDTIKTDYRDAEKICERLWLAVTKGLTDTNRFPTVFVPAKHIQILRKLFTSHLGLKQQIAKNKNIIHSIVKQEGMLLKKEAISKKSFRTSIEHMDLSMVAKKQINIFLSVITELEHSAGELEQLILEQGAVLEKEVRILTSIKGVSVLGALAIMADVADIRRFKTYKHFCSYLRTSPGLDASNKTIKVKHVNRSSRKLALHYLIQGIHHIKNSNPKMTALFERLRKGKSYGKSAIAVARHTMMHIYFMLRDGQYYYYRDIQNHETKMLNFKNMIEKAA